jgi:hypothetical protein
MAQGRMLKRKIVQNQALAGCTVLARLLFIYGMVHLDIDGRWYGEPTIWRSQLLPWDDVPLKDVKGAMDELAAAKDTDNAPLVAFYDFKGTTYCHYPGFDENQTLRRDREAPSDLPPPPADSTEWDQTEEETPAPELDAPPEDSGSPPGTREVKLHSREGKGRKLTAQDKPILTHWHGVTGFKDKMTMPKALELLDKLRADHPTVDLETASAEWAAYKIGRPLTAKSNPAMQLYRWMANTEKFNEEKQNELRGPRNGTKDQHPPVEQPGRGVFRDVPRHRTDD